IVFQKSVACTRSCPLGTIGNDLNEKQEIIRQDLRLFFSWAHSKLARFFAERKAAGELSQSADPDGLADLLITVMQGGMLVTKIERKTEIFERAAQQALNHIQNLRRVSR
ncbi:MAG: TetR family transcriptional regulator C-terminal domain-containing protein, partial [Bdellovibrionales bacterium]|nr:TetR family transcriptional regulator C-terminal domain-containing protein [Bdellovibrionales bacterium]